MPTRKWTTQGTTLTASGKVSGLTKPLCLALAVAAMPGIGTFTASPAQAETNAANGYAGGKARVNRSASLRSLTEAVASASCRVRGQIATETATNELVQARDSFATIIDGLINGSATLGMPGAERRARTLGSLNATADLWAPVQAAADALIAGTATAADAALVQANYPMLFSQTEQTASDISGQYADPQALLQSDATVINFAVRQGALGHRMTRLMCELATGTATETTAEELASTVDLFEKTLIALRDGFPGAGINPPPNEAIADSLNATFALWNERRALFDAAVAGGQPSLSDVAASAQLSQDLSVAMNNTVTLYLIATPGQEGVYRIPLEAYARNELANWLSEPALIAAIQAQNVAHTGLSEDDVIALDLQWRAEAGEGGGPLINRLLSSDLSGWLLNKQEETAGFVTEVFIMDNKGLNVAQSVETSDYWQGDEAKWKQTYNVGPNALHISEVEFDDSTGFYQSQASLAITDPATGEVIGAVTFGINVQSLL